MLSMMLLVILMVFMMLLVICLMMVLICCYVADVVSHVVDIGVILFWSWCGRCSVIWSELCCLLRDGEREE